MPIEIHDPLYIRPNPDQYILDEALKKAVEVALAFNQPLLLTGEPGTGKTLLAYKVAYELHRQTSERPAGRFGAEPLRFDTKTTSTARDLFYTYDAIGHFQQANIKTGAAPRDTAEFIELQALGKAIALANPQADYAQKFRFETPLPAPQSSVVLVDEVDKAPRDFTNDILNEIERQEFYVKEQDNFRVHLGDANTQRILIVMTSNSEKNLPEAFLRRCIFYNIEFPGDERLLEILKAQINKPDDKNVHANLNAITALFRQIRDAAVRKPPATAELVAFIKMLELDGLLDKPAKNHAAWYLDNLSLLVKTREDIDAIRELLKKPTA